MKHPLKDAIREQIGSIQLSDAQLDTLNALQSQTGRVKEQAGQSHRWWYTLAGTAALITLTLGLLLNSKFETRDSDNLIVEIAAEVVRNHLNRKPLEVSGSRLDSISDYFTRLDFVPVDSDYLKSKGLTLLGGRYCSLQGVTAAQLRFESAAADGMNTLYQVGYDPGVFKTLPDYDSGQPPVTLYSSGVKVTLWVEKGVLFALTEE